MSQALRTRWALPLVVCVTSSTLLFGCGGSDDTAGGGTAAPLSAADACSALQAKFISADQIGLPTTGAIVRSATLVRSTDTVGGVANTNGEYCKLIGGIDPVDQAAASIVFEVNLPTAWNTKAVHFGGGGFNGSLNVLVNGLGSPLVTYNTVKTPLARGYATFGSDSGHQQQAGVVNGDVVFALNDEQLRNYAGDALKKTRDVAVALIKARYSTSPTKTYFAGGSTGGREAHRVAQLWPQDYDGVFSAFSAWNQMELYSQYLRVAQANAVPGGLLSAAKRALLNNASIAACDALDGLKDGIVSNLGACHFDIQTLRCPNGTDAGDSCLSDAQITTVNVNHTPQQSVMLPSGVSSVAGYNVLEGGDLSKSIGLIALPDAFWKYFVAKDSTINTNAIDLNTYGPYQARVFQLSSMFDSTADLSAFQKRGGKFIFVHGQTDTTVPTGASTQYYQLLQSKMGQTAIDQFVRFALIPGYDHSVGVFNAGVDPIGMLEDWVEKGIAPDNVTVYDKNAGTLGRSRPLCIYPKWPKYSGSGDVNAAASFTCVAS